MTIEQLMSRPVLTVAPETTLKEVARLLSDCGISGAPVCDADGRVVGVVSEADILRKEQGVPPLRGRVLSWLVGDDTHAFAQIRARTAGEVMSSPAITIAPTASVAKAAAMMLEHGVNRLPVVADGELVGIVTRADLVRAFRRSDEQIEREISYDVLLHTLWVSTDRIAVEVHDGEVTLRGRVDTRSGAELVEAYVRRVPGVVDVRSELTWAVDNGSRGHLELPRWV